MSDCDIIESAATPGTFLWDNGKELGFGNKALLFTRPEEILMVPPRGTEKEMEELFQALSAASERGLYAAGWISYEAGYLLIPKLKKYMELMPTSFPLAWFGLYKNTQLIEKRAPSSMSSQQAISLDLDTSRDEFIKAIDTIHNYIRSGDTYQINYTIRGRFNFNENPYELYRLLQQRQQVRYSSYIHPFDNHHVLSLSPELFFMKKGQKIWSKPMKGTARRGKDSQEDEKIARQLQRDEKNRAENVMIVDLLRNDLGRICETGSVKVPELFKVERYETLFQMISTIEGALRPGNDWYEIFKALFPCGSITGAPKIRSMEIIAELERSPREIYTGAIGIITPENNAIFNVAIRTITLKNGVGEIGIGAGVTIGSDGNAEFDETLLKARFLTKK